MPELHLELEDESQNGQSAYCVAMCVLQECDSGLNELYDSSNRMIVTSSQLKPASGEQQRIVQAQG